MRKIVFILLLLLSVNITVFANSKLQDLGEIDFSEAMLIKFDKDLDFSKIYKDIRLLNKNENKKEIDILINKHSNREVIVIPLSAIDGENIEFSFKIDPISIKNYEGQTYVGNSENLKKIYEILERNEISNIRFCASSPVVERSDLIKVYTPTAKTESVESSSTKDFSTTNVQVEGVDEGDIIKTDGEYIYYIRNKTINIVKADTKNMHLSSIIDLENKDKKNQAIKIYEIYIEGNKLVVISEILEYPLKNSGNNRGVKDKGYSPRQKQITKIDVYDITNKTHPVLLRSIKQEGAYQNSRKQDSHLYVISSAPIFYYTSQNQNLNIPQYSDSFISDEKKEIKKDIKIEKIMIFPGYLPQSEPQILLTSAIDLNSSKDMKITSFIGKKGDIYMSLKNLYLTYEKTRSYNKDQKTCIKKFSVNKTDIKYMAKTDIKGWLINQFAMDESGDYFRVAYTRDRNYSEKGSSLSVFDKNMKLVGNLENIAPSERIHSVRFMGDRAYMVTFKNVDPLFVIDLKVPKAPKILGYLKIPGVSEYLHPYDENTLIGFGYDTTTNKHGNALYLGLKMSLFDVSNVSKPIEKDVVILGDRGTTSELISNHKALMYDRKRGIMGFPISIAKVDEKQKEKGKKEGFQPNGETVFKGALLYKVSKNKFKKMGDITHFEDFKSYHYSPKKTITRLIYIGDTVYSISGEVIMASDLKSLKTLATLNIENIN